MKPYETPEIKEKLDLIKDAVLSAAPETEAIYLFGSYVYGEPHSDSDLDIYVVVPDSVKKRKLDLEYEIIHNISVKRLGVPYDLMVQHSGVFERIKREPTIAGIVADAGVKLYG
ncbi:MAG: nucleotidyltransferase domain-containing protein [Oscillospiraceae bacterium]|nr:nucleotidyltransferase domain-containing protein [Oscillospiraceae bacterium]